MGKCLQKHIASSDYKVVFSSNLTVVNSKGILVDLRAMRTFADASPVFLGPQHVHGCPRVPGVLARAAPRGGSSAMPRNTELTDVFFFFPKEI